LFFFRANVLLLEKECEHPPVFGGLGWRHKDETYGLALFSLPPPLPQVDRQDGKEIPASLWTGHLAEEWWPPTSG